MVAYFHLQKFLFACDLGHFLTKVKVYARQMHVSILVFLNENTFYNCTWRQEEITIDH